MIKYFQELLKTLKEIKHELICLNQKTLNQEEYLRTLSGCVRTDHHSHGDISSISTKHWND